MAKCRTGSWHCKLLKLICGQLELTVRVNGAGSFIVTVDFISLRQGSVLFVFSLGLGALLILVGTFAGVLSALPKSGQWMVFIKKIFGVLMIIIGEFFIIKAGQLML